MLLADMVINFTFIDGSIQLFAIVVHPHARALTLLQLNTIAGMLLVK